MASPLSDLIEAICKPNPKPAKTSEETLLFQRNKTTLLFLVMLVSMRLIKNILTQAFLSGLPLMMSTIFLDSFHDCLQETSVDFYHLVRNFLHHRPIYQQFERKISSGQYGGNIYHVIMHHNAHSEPKHLDFCLRFSDYFNEYNERERIIIIVNVLKELSVEEIVEKYFATLNFYLPVMFVASVIAYQTLNQSAAKLARAKTISDNALAQFKTFILSLSHELRNPINSLLGNLGLLITEEMSFSAKEMVNTSKVCAELLLQLINNILDSGKIETGTFEVQSIPTNVFELMSKIWICSSELIKRKKLASVLKIAHEVPPMLMLDP